MIKRDWVLAFFTVFVLPACDGGVGPDDDLDQASSEATSAPHRPYAITSLTAAPGPGVGEVTLRWEEDGKYTTGFVLETGLTSFSKTDPTMPVSGRHAEFLTIPHTARSITLKAAQVTADGAPVASGNHLYFRLSAVNKNSAGATSTHYYPHLEAVLPRPEAPPAGGEKMRVASFNVRTARATTDARTWLERAPDVAAQIVHYNPGLVALQELGPGRADGHTGTLEGHPRQTDSLLTALDGAGGAKYDLVRTTPYVQAGVETGTQGMRILYDTTRYTLKSSCPESTDGHAYSASCSFPLPILSTDAEDARRRATYAEFEDRASGKPFWFVSTHLDERHDDDPKKEAVFDGLRERQAETIATTMDEIDTQGLPLLVAGDFNSWQNNRGGNSPHDVLTDRGYYDTSAAVTRKNFEYSTMNHFDRTMTPAAQGVGARIDMILVKGARGAFYFENVMNVTDAARPSDHNMIVTDLAPFAP